MSPTSDPGQRRDTLIVFAALAAALSILGFVILVMTGILAPSVSRQQEPQPMFPTGSISVR
jgi:hypothetical protein